MTEHPLSSVRGIVARRGGPHRQPPARRWWNLFFPGPPSERWTIILLICTFAYLCLELGFNARLLDVTGRRSPELAIHGIEQWGRIISGVAIALAACGCICGHANYAHRHVKDIPPWPDWIVGFLCALCSLVVVIAAWSAEKGWIDYRVNSMSAAERRVGVTGLALRRFVFDTVDASNSPPPVPVYETSYALFPARYWPVLDGLSGVDAEATAGLKSEAEQQSAIDGAYNSATEAISRLRGRYADAQAGYATAMNDAQAQAQTAWNQYVQTLADHNLRPETVKSDQWYYVANQVRAKAGLEIPDDWVPSDRATFDRVALSMAEDEASAKWLSAVAPEFPEASFDPHGSFAAFLAEPAIQSVLRRRLSLGGSTAIIPLTDGLSEAVFRSQFYEPLVEARAKSEWQAIRAADDRDFEAGGSYLCDGKAAAYARLLPGFSLTLSVLGVAYHSSKIVWYAFGLFPQLLSLVTRLALRGSLLGAIVAAPYLAHHASPSTAPDPTVSSIIELRDVPIDFFGDWLLRAQELYYPANDWIRRHLLSDVQFVPFRPEPGCAAGSSAPPPPLERDAASHASAPQAGLPGWTVNLHRSVVRYAFGGMKVDDETAATYRETGPTFWEAIFENRAKVPNRSQSIIAIADSAFVARTQGIYNFGIRLNFTPEPGFWLQCRVKLWIDGKVMVDPGGDSHGEANPSLYQYPATAIALSPGNHPAKLMFGCYHPGANFGTSANSGDITILVSRPGESDVSPARPGDFVVSPNTVVDDDPTPPDRPPALARSSGTSAADMYSSGYRDCLARASLTDRPGPSQLAMIHHLDTMAKGALSDCTANEQARLDADLNATYRQLMASRSPPQQLSLRQSERAWLRDETERCTAVPDAGICYVREIAQRLEYLKSL
jgi:hypothetical protein